MTMKRLAPDTAETFDVEDNRLTLLPEGGDRLDTLLALIEAARGELRLLYYIFAPDCSGTRVRDALIAACGRGVAVSLLVDGFGSDDTDDVFFAPYRAAGGTLCRFVPRFGRRYLLRNHQKMAIADTGAALIGGFNVEDGYFSADPDGWRDLGLLVQGGAVPHLARYFDTIRDWSGRPKATLRQLNRLVRDASQKQGRVRWLFGGPTPRLSPWARTFRDDARRARRLDLIAAYFAPAPGLLRGLSATARRAEVRIVTAAKSDNSTTIAAARHTYKRLLKAGARLFEYQPQKLHTKLVVADDASHVGSANCDMRSLFLNLEIMLRVEDAALAAALRRYVDREIADSREARFDLLHAHAGPWTRVKWGVAYFLVAVVDYTITRRLNLKRGIDKILG
jgi:cardiolipin synthase